MNMNVNVKGKNAQMISVPYAESEMEFAVVHEMLVSGIFSGNNPTCDDCIDESDTDGCYIHNLSFSLSLKLGIGQVKNGKRIVRLDSFCGPHKLPVLAFFTLDNAKHLVDKEGSTAFQIKEMWHSKYSCGGHCNVCTNDIESKCIVPCDFYVKLDIIGPREAIVFIYGIDQKKIDDFHISTTTITYSFPYNSNNRMVQGVSEFVFDLCNKEQTGKRARECVVVTHT